MKSFPKVSLVITVRNEAKTIKQLFESIVTQTVVPAEVVVVDGGSSDGTVRQLHSYASKWPHLRLRIEVASGSIAVGRNRGVRLAQYDWIAMTDAGCELAPTWLEQLLEVQESSAALIIAGYAIGDPRSAFESAVVPYVLVMPDKIDSDLFLPATRSVLFHKSVWKRLGGFPESIAVSEDYAFARAARASGISMAFASKAVVRWRPRKSATSFFWMIFAQARDDILAGSLRPKVGLVWIRYIAGVLGLCFLAVQSGIYLAAIWGALGVFLYSGWAVWKSYRYVGRGCVWLPALQFLADGGVIFGSGWGVVRLVLSK